MLTRQDFLDRYDAIVVGARCAGAATAMLLARTGARVLLVDRMLPGTDTLSTHALMRGAVMQLSSWGLLDKIVAAGTPAIRRTSFTYGDEQIELAIKPTHGVEALYAPRRTVLDTILVQAAVAAGADYRPLVSLVGLHRDADGRVTGAELHAGEEHTIPIAADLVVGADGRRSTVARLVGATETRTSRHASACVYAYARIPSADGYFWQYRPGISAGVIPTNDGLACLFVGVPPDRYMAEIRGRFEAGLLDGLAEVEPEVAELARGRIVGRAIGFVGQPGYMRRASGPGWALVGDAGYFKDPITAHGITDALRDAEALARAVLAGRGDALARYEEERDALSLPLFEVTDAIAGYDWTLAELKQHHLALNAAMRDENEWIERWRHPRAILAA